MGSFEPRIGAPQQGRLPTTRPWAREGAQGAGADTDAQAPRRDVSPSGGLRTVNRVRTRAATKGRHLKRAAAGDRVVVTLATILPGLCVAGASG